MDKIYSFIKSEPAIFAALAAFVGLLIASGLDWVTLQSGEFGAILAAFAAAAGITRQKVSPTDG